MKKICMLVLSMAILPTVGYSQQFSFSLGDIIGQVVPNKPDKVYMPGSDDGSLIINRDVVTVFGRDNCAFTRRAINELEKRHIPYQYMNEATLSPNQSKYNQVYFESLAYVKKGGVPWIMYKGKGVIGYSNGIIDKLMKAKTPVPKVKEVDAFAEAGQVESYCAALAANGIKCNAYRVGQMHDLNNNYMESKLRKLGYNGPVKGVLTPPVVITETAYYFDPAPDALFKTARIPHGQVTN